MNHQNCTLSLARDRWDWQRGANWHARQTGAAGESERQSAAWPAGEGGGQRRRRDGSRGNPRRGARRERHLQLRERAVP